MAEPDGFFTYDQGKRTLSRPGFKFRPGDPEGEDYQPGLDVVLGPDHTLVRRSAEAGHAFVYLPSGDSGVLVRAGELFLLPAASADELLNHPTAKHWEAAEPKPRSRASKDDVPDKTAAADNGPSQDDVTDTRTNA